MVKYNFYRFNLYNIFYGFGIFKVFMDIIKKIKKIKRILKRANGVDMYLDLMRNYNPLLEFNLFCLRGFFLKFCVCKNKFSILRNL